MVARAVNHVALPCLFPDLREAADDATTSMDAFSARFRDETYPTRFPARHTLRSVPGSARHVRENREAKPAAPLPGFYSASL